MVLLLAAIPTAAAPTDIVFLHHLAAAVLVVLAPALLAATLPLATSTGPWAAQAAERFGL